MRTRVGESVVIGGTHWVTVIAIKSNGEVILGFDSPPEFEVDREEVFARKQQERHGLTRVRVVRHGKNGHVRYEQ